MHPAKFNVSLFLQQKRWRKRRSRLRAAMIRQRARARAEEHRLLRRTSFGKHSVLIDMLANVHTLDKPAQGRRIEVTVPKTFSMLSSPDMAISMVAAFARSFRGEMPREIVVDMSKVIEQDLGAHVLLDKLVDEIDQESKALLHGIRWSGNYPESQPMARFVRAMGIVKQLNVEHEYPGPSESAKLKIFQRHCRHYVVATRPTSADDRSIAVARFAEHMDSCLSNAKRRLTPMARAKLCNYVGEIIDNAIQHAGMNDWTIQGYLDTSLATPMCEIVILNFGKSFAQTLEELPPKSYTTDQISGYLDRHAKSGFFTRTWNRETLLTLIALQGMVSSKNRSEADTRGQGTADLIEFFQKVHDECNGHAGNEKARMSIISGGTRIVFDGTYRIRPNENRTRIIAFNEQNDLYSPPDGKYVMSLQGTRFPGTLIAIQFPLSAGNTTGEAKNG